MPTIILKMISNNNRIEKKGIRTDSRMKIATDSQPRGYQCSELLKVHQEVSNRGSFQTEKVQVNTNLSCLQDVRHQLFKKNKISLHKLGKTIVRVVNRDIPKRDTKVIDTKTRIDLTKETRLRTLSLSTINMASSKSSSVKIRIKEIYHLGV